MLNSITSYVRMHQSDTLRSYSKKDLDLLMSDDMPESVKVKILASYNKAQDISNTSDVSNPTDKPQITDKYTVVRRSKNR
ncbi:hypothetical protein [Cysteiniphilum litorale]|uniref:hypothetical protein n=1 Tax=Cysteiniphilum litorale TaxID=2056700 RepID=UPI003F885C32